MSETEGLFEDVSGGGSEDFDEGSEGSGGSGGGEESCCGKLCSAMVLSILGCVLLPTSLFLCGWNEKNYVCEQKNILDAQTNSVVGSCDTITGGYVSFNCVIDTTSYMNFKGADFDRLDSLAFSGVSAQRRTEAWWCIETQSDSSRRLESAESESSNRDLLSPRRLSSRRRSKQVTYKYHMGWTSDVKTDFHDNAKAARYCPSLPTPPDVDSSDVAATTKLKAGKTGQYILTDEDFIAQFSPTKQVDLSPDETATVAVVAPPEVRTKTKEYIYSCDSTKTPTAGCTRDSYFVNQAPRVATLVEVELTSGQTSKHPTAASWGCSAGDWFKVIPTDDAKMDKAKVIEDANAANDTQVFMLRIVGVLMAWAAVYCMLYPLVAMADVMGDCLDMIPCIGDMLESIVEGMVTCVVCMISCSTGCSCALFVICLVWIFMRPLYGAIGMTICICMCACSYFVASSNSSEEARTKNRKKRKGKKGKKKEFMDESEDAEE